MTLPPGFVLEGEEHSLPEGFVLEGEDPVPSTPTDDQTLLETGFNTVAELAAAVNRGVVNVADLPANFVNAVLQVSGSDARIPLIGDQPTVQKGTTGMFMEQGTARDIVRTGGEFAAPVPPIMQAAKSIKRGVSAADDVAKMAFKEQTMKLADDIPLLPSPANIPQLPPPSKVPGAKTVSEVIDAATKGGEIAKFVSNPQAADAAEFVLKGGKLVKDPIAKQAVKQGLDKGLVSMIKTTSGETRKRMADMLEIVKRGKENQRFADRYRPWDVAGKAMTKRISFIKNVNSKAGKAVNVESKKLAGQFVDYSPAMDNFIDELDDLGVLLVRNEKGNIVPDFTKSVFRSSAKPKKIVSDIIKHLDTDNVVDAREVHIAKGFIDELVNWGKGATGNAGKVENVAKGLRKGLNDTLGDAFPAYKQANQTYSDTLNVLEDIGKSSGVKLRLDDDNYAQAVGTGLRRLLSNAQSKSVLSKAADDIEALSIKHGSKFADDVRDQVSFANQLDALFGTSAKTSLAGESEKVAERVAETALGTRTLTGMIAEGGKAAMQAARGVNEENAFKSLEALLKTQY